MDNEKRDLITVPTIDEPGVSRPDFRGFQLPRPPLYCLSCSCPYSFREPPEGPRGTCAEELCPCHTAYWQTVPENVKRRLWGDR